MKFIAENSTIRGNVEIEDECSIYYGTVIRSESDRIIIKKGSNVQDNCVIHTDEGYETVIGEYVTLGHGSIVHGAKIGDNTIIGMGSIILNGATIGKDCMIGAGTLISENKVIPDGSLVYGSPYKIVRELSEEERKKLKSSAMHYIALIEQLNK